MEHPSTVPCGSILLPNRSFFCIFILLYIFHLNIKFEVSGLIKQSPTKTLDLCLTKPPMKLLKHNLELLGEIYIPSLIVWPFYLNPSIPPINKLYYIIQYLPGLNMSSVGLLRFPSHRKVVGVLGN